MFNIREFSAHLNETGTLQTNKFYVEIPAPLMLGANDLLFETMLYRASNVRIPGVGFDVFNTYRYGIGPQEKFPTNVNFQDISINFIDTNTKEIWKYFYIWFNMIFDFTGAKGGESPNYTMEYKKYFTTDIFIHVQDNSGRTVNIVALKEAYPISLDPVSLAWDSNNKLYEFTVNFTFREWYIDGYRRLPPYQSGAEIGPGQTTRVAPPAETDSPRPTDVQDQPRPRRYSSATESSTDPNAEKYPQIAIDVENARKGRESPPGAAGFRLQDGQSVTGNDGEIRPFSLGRFFDWFRR